MRKELALIDKLEKIENEQGPLATASIAPLLDLSLIYVAQDRCPDAISMLKRGIRVSQVAHGLFNPEQLELIEPLNECYLALELPEEFERQQQNSLLIADINYGKDNPDILPVLKGTALWYEEAGWYFSARKLYTRSIEILEKAEGPMDLRLVDLLRSVARTHRLEYLYSDAESKGLEPRLDSAGEKSLHRAIRILRSQPEIDQAELVDAMLDLGDWHQMGHARQDALRVYKDAWLESRTPDYNGTALFRDPMPVPYRPQGIGVALHRPQKDKGNYHLYSVDFDFTVTRDGAIEDVQVVSSNAPGNYQSRLTNNFKSTRYRPRFVEGEPVATQHVRRQQRMYVAK